MGRGGVGRRAERRSPQDKIKTDMSKRLEQEQVEQLEQKYAAWGPIAGLMI